MKKCQKLVKKTMEKGPASAPVPSQAAGQVLGPCLVRPEFLLEPWWEHDFWENRMVERKAMDFVEPFWGPKPHFSRHSNGERGNVC